MLVSDWHQGSSVIPMADWWHSPTPQLPPCKPTRAKAAQSPSVWPLLLLNWDVLNDKEEEGGDGSQAEGILESNDASEVCLPAKAKKGVSEPIQEKVSANRKHGCSNQPDTSNSHHLNVDYVFNEELVFLRMAPCKCNKVGANLHVYKTLPKFSLTFKINMYHDPWYGHLRRCIHPPRGPKVAVCPWINHWVALTWETDGADDAPWKRAYPPMGQSISTSLADVNFCQTNGNPRITEVMPSMHQPEFHWITIAEWHSKQCCGSNPMTATLVERTSQQGAVAPVNNFYYYSIPPSTFPNASVIPLSAFALPYPIGQTSRGAVTWPRPLIPPHVSWSANTHPPPLLPPLPGPLPPFKDYLSFMGIEEDWTEVRQVLARNNINDFHLFLDSKNYNLPTLAGLGCPYREAVALCGKVGEYKAYL
ncbi:hypothetical protein CROQUDRAFT_135945 [Cronartium quercuum f. sp. fusiforme G11]|uniref:Uncharacterized protein n=1 Tax=Cronartium quercuum f. sp. fusiforme G11 TaxID=708437 RepID=A0A9P6ND49_9BASI|nr:hypothetical protein CROQUDRAFT_135945 [Cronartium quercuum f. sp. fusiforme G11]